MLSLVVNSLSLNLGAAPAPRVARAGSLSMMAGTATLNPELTKTYPRDFAAVPFGTAYGEGADEEMNKKEEDARLEAKLGHPVVLVLVRVLCFVRLYPCPDGCDSLVQFSS